MDATVPVLSGDADQGGVGFDAELQAGPLSRIGLQHAIQPSERQRVIEGAGAGLAVMPARQVRPVDPRRGRQAFTHIGSAVGRRPDRAQQLSVEQVSVRCCTRPHLCRGSSSGSRYSRLIGPIAVT